MSSSSRSPSTSTSHEPSPTPSTLPPLFSQLTFFLVPSKLDVRLLDSQISQLGGRTVPRAPDARVVITALRGRPRLERVLGRNFKADNLVSPAYVSDTYAAAQNGSKMPLRTSYLVFEDKGLKRGRSPSVEVIETMEKRPKIDDAVKNNAKKDKGAVSPPKDTKDMKVPPDVAPYPEDIRLRDIPRMCVERPCPLVCPNQDIIDAIKPIYTYREYDEGEQKNSNVLSYRRSMSILKSVPRRLRSGAEARRLVDVGEKVAQRIDEYLTTGTIAESAQILASERFQTLQLFASIHSIGTSTAVELWDKGCRNLDDVRRMYCGSQQGTALQDPRVQKREERAAAKRRTEGNMTREETVGAWLDLRDELGQEISRADAEGIAQTIMDNVEVLHPGCEWTITGGYRRGKPSTTDVDVVFSPPQHDRGLIKALCRRMVRLGIITHVLHISTSDPNTPLHSHPANFDNLDKAFVIMLHNGIHHRVDIIAAPRERYAAAVLSWSGSMMYERDLRRVAEERAYKFRAGLIDPSTNTEINLGSEREILAFLGLPYVPPELRNADA